MKLEIRNPKSEIRPWGIWLIYLLLCGHLIFCHGCHGEDVDDELCVPPPATRKSETRNPKSGTNPDAEKENPQSPKWKVCDL